MVRLMPSTRVVLIVSVRVITVTTIVIPVFIIVGKFNPIFNGNPYFDDGTIRLVPPTVADINVNIKINLLVDRNWVHIGKVDRMIRGLINGRFGGGANVLNFGSRWQVQFVGKDIDFIDKLGAFDDFPNQGRIRYRCAAIVNKRAMSYVRAFT